MKDPIEVKIQEMLAEAGDPGAVTRCGGCGKTYSHPVPGYAMPPPPCPACGWTMKPVTAVEKSKRLRVQPQPHTWLDTDELVMGYPKRICTSCGAETLQAMIAAPCVPKPLFLDQIELIEAIRKRPTRMQILAQRAKRRRIIRGSALAIAILIAVVFAALAHFR